MITLNLDILNKMVNGVSTDSNRYYLNGIHIYDKEGFRYYEATDGYICFRAVAQIDGTFPDINNIIPKNREFASQYTMFAPDILKKLIKFYGSDDILGKRPIMSDCTCPALWEWEDNDVKYMALVMPRRVEKAGE